MARSPIERMIDASCECLKCGAKGSPGACGCWIRLKCPHCGKTKMTDRQDADPAHATELQIECPECDRGDFGVPAYFDASGRHILEAGA